MELVIPTNAQAANGSIPQELTADLHPLRRVLA
jgi:hypothetical protein